jgi:hypothetical protein
MSTTIRTWTIGVAVTALLTATNGSQGGYFSQSWGWIALAFLAAISLSLIVGSATWPGPLRLAFAALIAALGVWVAVSATWSLTPAGSLREAERMLVYLAAAAAIAFVVRRSDTVAVAAGVFAGAVTVSGYALATRLFQDRFESFDDPTQAYRLSEPIGYWNALGLLAALGILLGIGFVAEARHRLAIGIAGGSLPILAATLYFTFSRGGWAVLAFGVVAMVALDPRRLPLTWSGLVVAPASVVCVGFASQYDALTTEGAARSDAIDEGRRFALVVLGLVIMSAALAIAARWLLNRVALPTWTPRVVNAIFGALLAVAVVVALVLAGGPIDAVTEFKERFESAPAVHGANLNDRLFSASGNGREESLSVAWDAGRERPILGHGAGSFGYLWYEERPSGLVIRDAHSLYAETFAELGVVGISLLASALLLPLVAAVRVRDSRLVPASAAVYLAWVAHAGLDWDWEIVGVTLTGLLAGSVALLAAERGVEEASVPPGARWPLLAASVALTTFALVSLVGNQALFAGREAVLRKEWSDVEDHARRAERLLPWSFEPHIVLGDAAAGLGDRPRAVAEYRRAVTVDSRNWIAWLRLAQVARGPERRAAYERVHELNPLERDLPGEPDGGESP